MKNAIIKSFIVYVFSIINNKINTIIETKNEANNKFIFLVLKADSLTSSTKH